MEERMISQCQDTGKLNIKRVLMLEDMSCKCCPVFNTFNIIGKKFSILILRNMIYNGHKRFNEFLNTIEEINPKTLSIRLKEMEGDGLITRRVYNETPIRIEYELTQKGKELQPILEQMALFSIKYCSEQVFDNPDSSKINKVTARVFEESQRMRNTVYHVERK
ncbi:MAG TPA: helix-turn-helix domain-containing protein [Candidatus Nitrosocosmicus sp.]|uniref:winged helix-turn-helix transcriptional regulator n=1 Tax=Candidatus Nitrosocosmicus agrestis TaxID=2563600 RepID=UPI001E536CCC|nr:helix-turn-helix domain-containing protein [Candidatus Nitrosocosmicus sp. SS]MDR4489968.1 helix-turn-helix transcriptional regulator [Candidatus Nitrosocosmicus sp.]HET6590601.1 helix-turn-helix domain-containing protein [Candidatus Nitrosocosmicus sp.]